MGLTLRQTINLKTEYKSDPLSVTGTEQEYDLGDVYYDANIMVSGKEPVLIKLNNNGNDEILLVGGSAGRDILSLEDFELTKVYYKTYDPSKTSEISIIALK